MLRARIIRLWDRSIHAATRIAYLSPVAQVERYGLGLVRDVPYTATGHEGHLLDVYIPKNATRPPAMLYVHGGGFALLSKETHRIMAVALARRGYAVFLCNYRMAPGHRYPAPLEDVAAAVQWVADNAHRYGADASRLVLAGESAGGNLVTSLAYLATHPRPEPFARAVYERNLPIAAVLAIYAFLDMGNLPRFSNPKLPWYIKAMIWNAAAAYVGHPVSARAAHAPLASPLRLIVETPAPGARPLPPFFLACGTADPLLVDSKKLFAALQSRGVPVQLSIHPGEIHGFNAMLWRKEARAMWRAAYRFLRTTVPSDPARPSHPPPPAIIGVGAMGAGSRA